MAHAYDDSDMKIAAGRGSAQEDAIDATGFLYETAQQHFNGNIPKAKQLGAQIVSAFSYRAAPQELTELIAQYHVASSPELLLQIRILSVFSAEYCLKLFLPSQMLSTVALGEMYETLMCLSPELYQALSKSAAFSLYYLAARGKEGDCAPEIGQQLAEMCDDPENRDLAALGEALHRMNVQVYKKAIDSFVFV